MLEVSYSKVNMWHYCPRMYEFSYEKKLKAPVPVALVFGNAIHRAIEWLYRGSPPQKLRRLQNGYSQLYFKSADSFVNFWKFLWSEFTSAKDANPSILGTKPYENIKWSSDDLAKTKEEYFILREFGANLLRHYYQKHSQNGPFPIEVEKSFYVPLGMMRRSLQGVWLKGVFDQIWHNEKNGYIIVDFKTGWRFYSIQDSKIQLPLHKDFQLSLYSLAFRYLYKVEEHCIIWYPLTYKKDKNGNIDYWKPVPTFRTETDHIRALDRIETFIKGINRRQFDRTSDYNRCLRCPFFEPCWQDEVVATRPLELDELPLISIQKQTALLEEKVNSMSPLISEPRLKLKPRVYKV